MGTKEKSTTEITNRVVEILEDYATAIESRENSLLGRKEVFMGKAKFGIFGDGKEVPQLAMARAFRDGDFRSGYYRDQTFMMAIGQLTSQQFFAQLYAHTSVDDEPASAGRMMNGHFGTRILTEKGEWKTLTDTKNSSSDISPTAAQMPRLLGLAYASKLYRNLPELNSFPDFSVNGNEVAFGTIGNASTSEGHFFEVLNAAGVLQVPLVMAVWDDGYGISVPAEYHTIKQSISEALSGFQRTKEKKGFEIWSVPGWDYPGLVTAFQQAASLARIEHVPCLIHVTEVTQPQGHSTSGSHERYKSAERLEWEKNHDCILKMREWILSNEIAEIHQLEDIEIKAKNKAKKARDIAWKSYLDEIKKDKEKVLDLIKNLDKSIGNETLGLNGIYKELEQEVNPLKANVMRAIRSALWISTSRSNNERQDLLNFKNELCKKYEEEYNSHIHSISKQASVNVPANTPIYSENSKLVDGREILQSIFDHHLSTNPLVFALGEDVGKIGDVNQGFAGLQQKYGELRVTDTSIRETSIIGQGIGCALRGLRPIVEIQYLDYLLYALQTLSDDLATLYYRTKGGQKSPLIIRTRGHRLEGVWHSGSPMGMIINAIRGIYVLVPRNMVQAAGFYNALLRSDDPALVIESLNGYRLKELVPDNLTEIITPIGIAEIIKEGSDITCVTYGSTCRIVMEAAQYLQKLGVSCEVIDVQSLLPFDLTGIIVKSLQKTNKIIFIDEDVPGGASAYMLQQVLERDNGYQYLDEKPITLTGKEHRAAYGSDGDYFSKPNREDIIETIYKMMHSSWPSKFPELF